MGTPELDGYTLQPAMLATPMPLADGPDRWQQERGRGSQRASLTIFQRKDQFIYFQGWFHHRMRQGSFVFQINLRTGNGYRLYRAHMDENGYSSDYSRGGDYWETRFDVTYTYDDDLNNYPLYPGDIIYGGTVNFPSEDGPIHGGRADQEPPDTVIVSPPLEGDGFVMDDVLGSDI